jgi:tetratricopeptide (TPR) repeat protein
LHRIFPPDQYYRQRAVCVRDHVSLPHTELDFAVTQDAQRGSSFLQLENFGLVPNPQSAPTHFNTANVLFKLKRYEEALASYDRALAIRPYFAEAHHGRGTVLRTFGRIEEARPLLEKAVELAPRRVEFVNTLAESKRFVESEADDLCAGGRTTDDQEGRAAPARKGAASEIMPDKLEP